MSAFMQSTTHIDALLTAGLRLARHGSPLTWLARELTDDEKRGTHEPGQPWGPSAIDVHRSLRRELTTDTAGRVGAMLLAQNRYSVDFRYAEEEIEEPYLFTELPGNPSPLLVLHAIAGYEYQACETPDWPQTEAYAFCAALRLLCINRLPGYDDLNAWSIDDPAVFCPKPVAPPPAPHQGPPLLTADDLKARKPEWAEALIVAELHENTSDMQSDYHGHKTNRRVAIGWRKGKRESFPQLRKAAATFDETKHLGPGLDLYTARLILGADAKGNGCWHCKGGVSPWHRDEMKEFSTLAEAEAYVAAQGPHEPIHIGGPGGDPVVMPLVWEIVKESYEHRECYSMGAGNYLKAGHSDSSGWEVTSTTYFGSVSYEDHLPN
jgi:hypothetical protein